MTTKAKKMSKEPMRKQARKAITALKDAQAWFVCGLDKEGANAFIGSSGNLEEGSKKREVVIAEITRFLSDNATTEEKLRVISHLMLR